MHRPAYNGVKKALSQSSEAQAVVFVSDRKQARLTALDFITMVSAEASSIDQRRFLGIKEGSSNYISDIKRKVNEQTLKSTLEMGVGFLHDGMSDSEKDYIKSLYKAGTIRLLVVIQSLAWAIDDLECHIVVILDAEKFDGHEHRSVEYSIPDVL